MNFFLKYKKRVNEHFKKLRNLFYSIRKYLDLTNC